MIFAPTALFLNRIHEALIMERGERGFMCEGMVQGSIERAMTYVYDYQPFPSLFMKAAALLYSITVFHPYVDGNKRTATIGTMLFLYFNGYNFNPPAEEAVNMALAIARQEVTDTAEIAKWIRKHSKRSIRATIGSILLRLLFLSPITSKGLGAIFQKFP